jgi:hypothetical protein
MTPVTNRAQGVTESTVETTGRATVRATRGVTVTGTQPHRQRFSVCDDARCCRSIGGVYAQAAGYDGLQVLTEHRSRWNPIPASSIMKPTSSRGMRRQQRRRVEYNEGEARLMRDEDVMQSGGWGSSRETTVGSMRSRTFPLKYRGFRRFRMDARRSRGCTRDSRAPTRPLVRPRGHWSTDPPSRESCTPTMCRSHQSRQW